MQQEGRSLLLHFRQCIFLGNSMDEAEIKTPDRWDLQAGSVPHTGQEPYHKDVERLVASVSSHWNIEHSRRKKLPNDMCHFLQKSEMDVQQ